MKNNILIFGIGILMGIAISTIAYLVMAPKPKVMEFTHPNQKTRIDTQKQEWEPLILNIEMPQDGKAGIILPEKKTEYHPPVASVPATGIGSSIYGNTNLLAIGDSTKGYTIESANSALERDKLKFQSNKLPSSYIVINTEPYSKISSIDSDSLQHFMTILNGKEAIHYSKGFLEKYPTAPKLLYNKITKDSIRFDLMQPNGLVTSSTFRTNILGYNYETNDGKFMKFTKLPDAAPERPNPFSGLNKTIHTESNIYLLYDPLQKVGRVRLDYSLMYNRTGLYFANQLQSMMPVYQAEVGLRYKLK